MVADKKSFFPAGEKKCEVESKDGYHSNARCERTEGRRGGCGGVTSCKVRGERELVGGDLLHDDDAADGELVGEDLLPLLHDNGNLLFRLDDDAD